MENRRLTQNAYIQPGNAVAAPVRAYYIRMPSNTDIANQQLTNFSGGTVKGER